MNLSIIIILLIVAGLVSASIASFIGLGGGLVAIPIIIAAIGDHTTVAKLLSYLSIFLLCVISLIKYTRQKRKPLYKTAGWILIGLVPSVALSHYFIGNQLEDNKLAYHAAYMSVVIFVTFLILFKEKLSVNVHNYFMPIFGGIIGMASGVLGLSGGVLFIPLLVITKKLTVKDAAITSLILKMAAAGVNIVVSGANNEFALFNDAANDIHWYFPLVLLTGSALGAIVGPQLNKISKPQYVNYFFLIVMLLIIINEILKITNIY